MMQRLISFSLLLAIGLSISGCGLSTTQPQDSKITSLQRLNVDAPARRILDIQTWQTASGTAVFFVQSDELPMLDLQLTFAAGSSQEGAAYGLAQLTNSLIGAGTNKYNADQIAQAFESLGAEFNQGSYRDMAILSLRTLSTAELSQPAVELFTEVITRPNFPAQAIQRVQNQLLASFEQQKKIPSHIANRALFAKLYGTHPYAHPSAGTEQTIPRLKRQQLADFYQTYYNAHNAQLALVGNLTRQDAEAIAEQISRALPQGVAASKTPQPQTPKATHQHIEFPSNQTHILLAQLGIERGHPDYAALFIANQILGGSGFGSRLMEEVREKRGLTYGIYSSFSPMQAQGPFTISVQTRAELSEATLGFVRELLSEYVQHGPTEAELATAKQEFLGSFPLTAASNAAIVGQLGAIGFYDLPLNWLETLMQDVQQLTLEQLNTALRHHIQPDALVVVTVGPSVPQLPLPEPVIRNTQSLGHQH